MSHKHLCVESCSRNSEKYVGAVDRESCFVSLISPKRFGNVQNCSSAYEYGTKTSFTNVRVKL